MDFRGRRAIFFITILCAVMNSEPTPPNLTRYPVKYFRLALQWPGAYRCPLRCPCDVSADFLIHGLWQEPSRNKSSCDPFNLPEGPLRRKMETWWPTFHRPCNNEQLWEHEWQKHGYFSNLWQSEYFNKTIKLREEVDPLGVLSGKGIVPRSEPYTTFEFRSALVTAGFKGPRIVCHERDVLYEIHFCVDKKASRIIRCPQEKNVSCGEAIYFLQCTPGTTPGWRTCRQPSLKSLLRI